MKKVQTYQSDNGQFYDTEEKALEADAVHYARKLLVKLLLSLPDLENEKAATTLRDFAVLCRTPGTKERDAIVWFYNNCLPARTLRPGPPVPHHRGFGENLRRASRAAGTLAGRGEEESGEAQ